MIIYNTSKELESKYMAQDDFVFEIHSQFTLDELLTKIRNGEEITPNIANIVAYSSKENSKFKDATTLEQNDYLDNMKTMKIHCYCSFPLKIKRPKICSVASAREHYLVE